MVKICIENGYPLKLLLKEDLIGKIKIIGLVVKSSKDWKLYCADRNSKWHHYEKYDQDYEPNKNFDDLLEELERDTTGIFWG